MENFEGHVGKIEAQLTEWGMKLDELVAKAEKAGAEAKADYKKQLADLKEKHKVARTKLDELKSAGALKWETFTAGLELARLDVEVAFKKLAS